MLLFLLDRVFGHFEKPLFLELCKHMEAKNVPAGGSLFKIGDEDNCIYVVQSGKMNVYITEGVGQQFFDFCDIFTFVANTRLLAFIQFRMNYQALSHQYISS